MSKEHLVTQLRILEPEYKPPEAELPENFREITVVSFIGPVAVGSSILMDAVAEADDEFGGVRSFTTRKKHEGEDEEAYYFHPHDNDTLRHIRDRVLAGKMVQFAVHPATGRVYGSTAGNYGASYSMLATLPHAFERLQALPFRKTVPVAVAAPPDQWEERMRARYDGVKTKTLRRHLGEGITNLHWLLMLEQDIGLPWAINDSENLGETAKQVADIIKGKEKPDRSARYVAAGLLRRMIEKYDAL